MAWPAAVLPCFISRFLYRPLSGEIHKGNAYIKELRANLEKSLRVSELYHVERDELGERYEREKAKRERLQYLVNLAREHGVNVEDFDK